MTNTHTRNTHKPTLDLVTIQDACDMFGVTRQTIGNWTRKGILQKIKPLRKVYYRFEDLEDLINNQLA